MWETQHAKNQATLLQSEAVSGMERLYEDELVMLRSSLVMIEAIEAWQLQLVIQLRDRDKPVTWAEIGDALGFTKQAAIQRYSRHMPPKRQ